MPSPSPCSVSLPLDRGLRLTLLLVAYRARQEQPNSKHVDMNGQQRAATMSAVTADVHMGLSDGVICIHALRGSIRYAWFDLCCGGGRYEAPFPSCSLHLPLLLLLLVLLAACCCLLLLLVLHLLLLLLLVVVLLLHLLLLVPPPRGRHRAEHCLADHVPARRPAPGSRPRPRPRPRRWPVVVRAVRALVRGAALREVREEVPLLLHDRLQRLPRPHPLRPLRRLLLRARRRRLLMMLLLMMMMLLLLLLVVVVCVLVVFWRAELVVRWWREDFVCVICARRQRQQ